MPDDRLAPLRPEVFHLALGDQRRFCIFYTPPDGRVAASVLYVHPFGEEMNKARRMAALQARALTRAGWSVLQLDLAGCGDSDGEFADASWRRWVDDVIEGAAWLEQRSGQAPWLWGLRAGCLLATDAARAMPRSPDLLFWQPVVSGRQYLQHLLRLRLAAQMMDGADATRSDTRRLREQLAQGSPVAIAGYELSPMLALGLERAELAPIPGSVRVAWMEASPADEPELSPAGLARIDAWRRAGHRVESRAVGGPTFWQTQEIAECPALIDATLTALAALHP